MVVHDFAVGDRIEVVKMPDDPCPIEAGAQGIITDISPHDDWTQLWVDWDNGRRLAVILPPDEIRKVDA